MLNEEKSTHITEVSGIKADSESQSKKFLSHGKHNRYTKLLVSSGSLSGVDKIPFVDKYEKSLKGDTDLDKKIIKLGESNELAYEDLILTINTISILTKWHWDQ